MDPVYRTTESTTWRELDGEIVALEMSQSVYYSIGGSGGVLWKRLVDGATRAELVTELTTAFEDLSPEQAEADIDDFLTELIDQQLIQATG